MSTTTSSLEKSLQNFSLNKNHPPTSSCSSSGSNGGRCGGAGGGSGGGISGTSSSDLIENHQHDNNEISYELNSHIRMPYHWEQCLDLKTGELYYINWRTGMKTKEDPRTTTRSSNWNGGFDNSMELEDENSYESEGSTTEESSSSPPSSSEQKKGNIIENGSSMKEEHVLVVAGCKNCYMYYMVQKLVQDCPKCTAQLIHFASP